MCVCLCFGERENSLQALERVCRHTSTCCRSCRREFCHTLHTLHPRELGARARAFACGFNKFSAHTHTRARVNVFWAINIRGMGCVCEPVHMRLLINVTHIPYACECVLGIALMSVPFDKCTFFQPDARLIITHTHANAHEMRSACGRSIDFLHFVELRIYYARSRAQVRIFGGHRHMFMYVPRILNANGRSLNWSVGIIYLPALQQRFSARSNR